MKSRQALLEALARFQPRDLAEEGMRRKIHAFVARCENCYDRDVLEGHITGSAWIVDPARTRTLLVHHAKLGLWLQPGGHADGDSDILDVARREMIEETGVDGVVLLGGAIFDVDAHDIPERKGVPAHVHYDIRFAFECDPAQPLILSEESHEVAWVPLGEVHLRNTDASVMRMVAKTREALG